MHLQIRKFLGGWRQTRKKVWHSTLRLGNLPGGAFAAETTVLLLLVGCKPPSADSSLFIKNAEAQRSHVSRRIKGRRYNKRSGFWNQENFRIVRNAVHVMSLVYNFQLTLKYGSV